MKLPDIQIKLSPKALRPVRKAVLAFFLPALGSIGAAAPDGNITRPEVVVGVGVGLVSGVGVYSVSNKPRGD